MIDVKQTIFETIKKQICLLRFQAKNDPKVFKKIIKLIILDDVYDWGDYLEEKSDKLDRLETLRKKYILNNPEFILKMFPNNQYYVNVNTPQTNNTWKRVWDSAEVEIMEGTPKQYIQSEQPTSFTPDSTCPTSLTYYGGELDDIKASKLDGSGKPVVDLNKLTVCEKMNLYINRNTGELYFLNPGNCQWETVKGQLLQQVSWTEITGKPEIYQGIKHSINQLDSNFNVSLLETGETSSDVPIADSNDLNDVL